MSDRIEKAAAALSGAVEKAGLRMSGGIKVSPAQRRNFAVTRAKERNERNGLSLKRGLGSSHKLSGGASFLEPARSPNTGYGMGGRSQTYRRIQGGGDNKLKRINLDNVRHAIDRGRAARGLSAKYKRGFGGMLKPIKKNMLRGGSGGMHVRLAMVNGSKIKGGTPRLLRAAKYLQARVKRPVFQAAHTARIAQRTAFAAARIGKSKAKTLYVYRPVTNADEIIAWAKGQGFDTTIPADQMHVTIISSKTPMNWARLSDDYRRNYPSPDAVSESGYGLGGYSGNIDPTSRTISGGVREVKALGDSTVLAFESVALTQRWADLRQAGAGSSFAAFQPHVSISRDAGKLDLSKVSPYSGPIQLGDECWEEYAPGAMADVEEV